MPNIEKARTFIYRNARPLDLARFQFHFEGGSAEAVLTALAVYQNEDGGFGHALELDNWNPNTTPIATWVACELLHEIGFDDASHPIMQGILRYLGSGKDFDGRLWATCPQSNADYPHAPWWNPPKKNQASEPNYNPTAALAGFILRFAQPGSEVHALGVRVAKEAADWFMAAENTISFLNNCYKNLLEWTKPVDVADVFDAQALAQKLQEKETEDSSISEQQDDGSWEIPWNWGKKNKYPAAFAISQNWWKSYVIVEILLKMKG
ncbi:MAG: hypothetical protein FWD06_01370 [Oscillospiraceae bacterium]|nr:hypothetical protein [Oscillospiraceae bacterium]